MHFARVIKCEGNHEDCPEGTTHICIRDTVHNHVAVFNDPPIFIHEYRNSTGGVQPLRDVSHSILSSQASTPAQGCLRCRAHVSQLLGEMFLYIPIHILHWLCRMHNRYKFVCAPVLLGFRMLLWQPIVQNT